VITTKYVRPPVVQTPTPNPNPTVSAEFVQTSNISSTVTGLQTFPLTNQPGLVDFQTAEADTGVIGQLNLVNTFSNNYYQYSADANPKLTDVYEVGSIADREAGTPDQSEISTILYAGSGNHTTGLIDVVPEPTKTGQSVAVGPPNDASQAMSEVDPDGQRTTLAVSADGSYTEGVAYPDGTKASMQEQSAGPTGFFSWPLSTWPYPPANTTVQVAAPSGGVIKITVSYPKGALGLPYPKVVTTPVPDWYPHSTQLYQQTYLNDGPTVLPNPFPSPVPGLVAGACNLGNDINGHLLQHIQLKPYSNLLVQTTNTLDVIFGETETITSRIWNTQGIGLTCSDTVDVIKQYYDYSGQSFTVPTLQNTPLQTTTIDIQLGLTQATINNQSYRFGKGANGMRGDAQQLLGGARSQSGPSGQSQPGLGGGQAQSGLNGGQSHGISGSDMLLARALTRQIMFRLQHERLARHALYWRQIRALRMKRTL